jgi:hypothetical protein
MHHQNKIKIDGSMEDNSWLVDLKTRGEGLHLDVDGDNLR